MRHINIFLQAQNGGFLGGWGGQKVEVEKVYFRVKNYGGSGKCIQESISDKVLVLLRDRPCLQLIIVSSNFQALPYLQDKLLELV